MRPFLQRWFVTAAGVMVAWKMHLGITADNFGTILIASLLLGILNAFLRPVMMLFSLPLLLLTLGLFTLVINAILLLLVSWLLPPFHVAGFGAAFWSGLVISIVSMIANSMIGKPEKKTEPSNSSSSPSSPPPPRRSPPPGNGPIIDV